MVDFNDVLNKKADEVEKPKPRPAGSYLGSIVGMPKEKKATVSGEERTILEFSVKLMVPQDDVSQDALAEHPDLSQWAPVRYDLWLTDDLWGLKRFLTEVLGISGDGDKTFKEMLAEAPGRTAIFKGELKPYNDKSTGQPSLAFNLTGAVAA